jgi:probable F420-dependent oxidoreductase
MKFAFQFPMRSMNHWDEWIAGHSLGELAAAAEEAGFDLVCGTDHPFPDQQWVKTGGHHAFDPFVGLAFMAAAPTRVQLLTQLVVAGYRNPYITAKAAASLDNLSGGRLVLGLGVGYQEAEFDVLGADYAGRGKRFDAAIAAMRAAWTGEVVEHESDFYPAHGHAMLPKPAQPAGIPIWFGGNSKVAMRRVAEVGDGWMPFEQSEQMAEITKTPALTVKELADKVGTLRERRRELGRDEAFSVSFGPLGRRDVEGNVAAIAENLPDYAAAGATHLLIESRARSFDGCLAELQLFKDVIAAN